jgi:hypothetical protein
MRWDNEVSNAEINEVFFGSFCYIVQQFSLYSTELCSVIGYYNP